MCSHLRKAAYLCAFAALHSGPQTRVPSGPKHLTSASLSAAAQLRHTGRLTPALSRMLALGAPDSAITLRSAWFWQLSASGPVALAPLSAKKKISQLPNLARKSLATQNPSNHDQTDTGSRTAELSRVHPERTALCVLLSIGRNGLVPTKAIRSPGALRLHPAFND